MSLLLAVTGRAPVSIGNFTIVTADTGEPRDATVNFLTNGQITDGAEEVVRNWFAVTTTGIGNNYEIYAEIVEGTHLHGDFDEWLSLGSDRQWRYANSSPSANFAIISVSIRPVGTALIVGTGTITLEA